jgi:orotidine-5'-phosphate decarboxylase
VSRPAFSDKLRAAIDRGDSLLCVGLDPDPARLPAGVGVTAFNRRIIEATHDLVCCFKPNIAFFEALGRDGMTVLRDTLAAVPADVPVILDAKRGDIGHTAEAYARVIFEDLGADATTINAYGGGDSVEPFIRYADRGVFIWCRSSNPGATDLQDLPVHHEGRPMPFWQALAMKARQWDVNHNIGLVIGATYPAELAEARSIAGEMPILAPGVGAQAADIDAAVRAGIDSEGRGMIVNASRQVLYASSGPDYADAARNAALALRDAINRQRRLVDDPREA